MIYLKKENSMHLKMQQVPKNVLKTYTKVEGLNKVLEARDFLIDVYCNAF